MFVDQTTLTYTFLEELEECDCVITKNMVCYDQEQAKLLHVKGGMTSSKEVTPSVPK